jgi:YegS/Rv2252/BmrU family lipid kinase
MTDMRTCLIINPTAGQKVGLTTNALGLDDARALLERHQIAADILCTEHAGHGTELAQRAVRERYERVLAAGGDGTVAEVAEGLVGTTVELGVLPLGSVMNVARMLGVPRDLDAAAEVIKARRVARIDVGQATAQARTTYFLEAAGVGVDAGLFAYFNQLDRGNWRSLRPLITFMWRYRPRRLTLTIDGRRHRFRAMMVSIANGPYVGAALAVAPDARLDDHQFDVEVFTRFGNVELIRHLLSITGGRRVYNPKVRTFQASTVEVESERPMMVHADSNPLGTTRARFEVVPSALAVIVGGEPECLPALRNLPPPAQQAPVELRPDLACDTHGTIPDRDARDAGITATLATKPAADSAPSEWPRPAPTGNPI